MMDWDKLRIFHAVAEAGSFTHAGEKLNLSQSAVSRQISSLESSIGVILFHRHARGLVLTEQGELLQNAAQDIFAKLSMLEGQIHDSKKLPEGPLRITTAGFIGQMFLAPHLNEFRKKHPEIELTLLLDDRIYNLGMREADAGIRLYKPEQPDLIQRQLATLTFGIYANEEYLKTHGTPKNSKDLSAHTVIGYPESMPGPFPGKNWLLRLTEPEARESNHRAIFINSYYGIQRACKAGAGLAMLPRFVAEQAQDLTEIDIGIKPPTVDMFFVYPEDRRQSHRLGVFRDFVLRLVDDTDF